MIPIDVLNRGSYDESRELVDDELWGIISQVKKGAFLFSAIDACHSGSEFDLPYSLHIDPNNKTKYQLEKVERRPETQGAIVMLSGCQTLQTSLDAVDNTGHPAGALTYALCDYILHHTNDSIHFVDFLCSIRQQIVQHNPGVPNIQEPQLDFGRVCDAGLTFTLLPNGMAAQLTDSEQKSVKEILQKVYSAHVPVIEPKTIQTPSPRMTNNFSRVRFIEPGLSNMQKFIIKNYYMK